jgi:hypothetical protein
MIYLSENEVGFDTQGLGFPSIRGCHAIVYVTSRGLFGLHNYGGDLARDWPERSEAFKDFVTSHASGDGTGKALYGVCFATTQRAYGVGASTQKLNWTGELTAFADKLGFTGAIYGYDIAGKGFPPPAYVHVTSAGATCVIQVKPWDKADAGEGPNPSPADYQMIARRGSGVGYELKATKANVVISMTTTGLQTVYPAKLR